MVERIRNDLTRAMKEGNKPAVATLRLLISSIQYTALEQKKKESELDESTVVSLIQKAIRSRQESVESFRKGNREELARREEAEISILQDYLPAQLEGDELERAVDQLLEELGITEKKDFGRVMKEFMDRYRGRADGRTVNALIGTRLR